MIVRLAAQEMMRRIDKLPNEGWRRLPIPFALTFAMLLMLTGCINIIPVPRQGEKREAMLLAKVLSKLAPEAKTLQIEEHNCANGLRIDMEEAQDQVGTGSGREKFTAYVDRLIALRDKRQQIRDTVSQGAYESPMVFVIQHDAVVVMNDEIGRTQTWIELAQNLLLRADMHHSGSFTELQVLSSKLALFLNQPLENPLYSQVRDLQEEYRFGEGEVAP